MVGLWQVPLLFLTVLAASASSKDLASSQAAPAAGVLQQKSRPTHTLERRVTRSAELSTMSPVGVYVPEVYGVRNAGDRDDTSIYYYGSGFRPETSVFLLVTGSPGVGDGPQTTYLYEGPSEAYLANVLRTADLHDGNGTITGRFNVDCMYPKGFGSGGWCKIGRMTTQGTTMVSTYNSTMRPQSTMTPVLGLVDQMRQSTATGIREVHFPKTQSNADNAAYRAAPLAIATSPMLAALWTAPLALLVALLCL